MRLTLKHQILLAPAVVLFIMTLLLGFLQFSYWNLSLKRQQAQDLKTAYIALAEADLAAQRMHTLVEQVGTVPTPDAIQLEQMADIYGHLEVAVGRLKETALLKPEALSRLQQSLSDLDPQQGVRLERFDVALDLLRPYLLGLIEQLNADRKKLSNLHREDIDELVAQTTFVSILVLGSAIMVGILLSLTFARRILKQIHLLSESAERITRGEFAPPPAPEVVRDELDGLALSINQMTDQLIRVVAAEKVLEGAEEERRRIAMDIHDQTLADLSSVRRRIEQMRAKTDCGEAAEVIEADLQRAMTNLREVMDNLHPQTLDILGLPAAIESQLEKLESRDDAPQCHFLSGDDVADLPLSPLVKVTLYRIAVEAIHNVLRHAGASSLEVALQRRNAVLILAVEDNGHGFEYRPEPPSATGGRGLHNINERARAIGAQVGWGPSRFSSGTRFELSLPITTA